MALQLSLPHMQKQKSGHIINITSVFGIKVFAPGATVYCAAKAAGRALTEGLRMELHSQKYPLHDDFTGCCWHGTSGEQLGGGNQKEFCVRVLQNGYSRQLYCAQSLTPSSNQSM